MGDDDYRKEAHELQYISEKMKGAWKLADLMVKQRTEGPTVKIGDFIYEAVGGCLVHDGETVAEYTLSDGRFTVFPVAPFLSHIQSTSSDSVMQAFQAFAENCRADEKAKARLNLS